MGDFQYIYYNLVQFGPEFYVRAVGTLVNSKFVNYYLQIEDK